MSLQVWLPLTGHLNNQGLSNVTVTNNGATVDNNGKIGKCYSFNGTSSRIYANNVSLSNSEMTAACWVKFLATPATNTYPYAISLGYDDKTYGTEHQIGISWWKTSSSNTIHICANGSELDSGFVPALNTWYHLCFTYKGSTSKLYVNGNLYYTGTNANTPKTRTNLCIGARSASASGAGTSILYPLNGLINDVRIYDHALSAKEVKELSKGLVLHYPLTGGGRSGDNLVAGTKATEQSYTYPASSYSDKFSARPANPTTASQYTLSFYAKSTVNGDKVRSHWYSPNTTTKGESSQGVTMTVGDGQMDYTLSTEWKRYWCVYTQSETTSAKALIFPRLVANNGTGTVSVKCVKLEEGDHATPWMPNSADAEYTEMGYNSTTEYDVSGYNNHTTKVGTITYTSDSARYSVAPYFINGSYIMANKNSPDYLPKDSITVNLWIRCTTWGNPISCTESGGFNFENSSGNVGFIVYLSGVGYKTAYGIPVSNLTDGKWHMLTGVYDRINQVVNTYLDTQLMKTTATGSSAVIGYANNRLIISGEAQSTTPASSTFVGEESDVRIYATALSAEDIAELYNTAASLANNGTLFAYDFVEV